MGGSSARQLWQAIGPGLLFSGAAVGVSHLVQSTRAGAMFGLALVGVILLINILKYPAFRFGIDYGHATGRSLMAGYRNLGLWAPLLFCLVIAPVAPIGLAAIGATTAGIIAAITGTDIAIPVLASALMIGAAGIGILGGYGWLDRLNRLLLAFLILSTLATTAMVLPRIDWSTLSQIGWLAEPAALLFVIALAGFMPTPLDVSVSQSIWTNEAEQQMGTNRTGLNETRAAFLATYLLTALLAVCFCIMGAGVMHNSGVPLAPDAAGFAAQLIGLYREILGDGAALLAAIAALSVMLTTILVAFDINGRNFAAAYAEISGQRDPRRLRRAHTLVVIAACAGAIAALFLLLENFGKFIDLATSAAFLSAPIIATLNHRLVLSNDVPTHARPSPAIRILSLVAILVMAALAILYLWLRITG